MVELITYANRHHHHAVLDAMHADRKRVFVDTLRWTVPHDGRLERDDYDDEHAEYLVLSDLRTGDHLASLRLLRTDRRHLLGDKFAGLCERGVPRGATIREVTRLCVSPRIRARERLQARNTLIRALVDYALLTGITEYTAVAGMSWLTQILAAGWTCRPLGPPQLIAGEPTAALIIEIRPDTLQRFIPAWQCERSTLRIEQRTSLAA